MKKAYSKLSTDLLLVETEGAFMGCSVRGEMDIEVASYNEFNGFDDTKNSLGTKDEWGIGFGR